MSRFNKNTKCVENHVINRNIIKEKNEIRKEKHYEI